MSFFSTFRLTDGKLELDLESNSNDIRNPETHELDFSTTLRPVVEHVPEYWKSLRVQFNCGFHFWHTNNN